MSRFVIRDLEATDRPFVASSWVTAFRTSPYAGIVHYEDWSSVMTKTVDRILDDPLTRVRVVVDKEVAKGTLDLLGWIAYQPHAGTHRTPNGPLIHFIYVKSRARRQGLGRALINSVSDSTAFAYTCRTPQGDKFFRGLKRYPEWNPTIVRRDGRRRKTKWDSSTELHP